MQHKEMSLERGIYLHSIKVIKGVLLSLDFRTEGKSWTCKMKNLLVFFFTFSMLLMHVSGKFFHVFLLQIFQLVLQKRCNRKQVGRYFVLFPLTRFHCV